MMSLLHPLATLALPLAALPWLRRARSARPHPWMALLPPDRAASQLKAVIRILSSVAIAAVTASLMGPVWTDRATQHVGQGAEILLVLDRSLSMDQSFGAAGNPVTGSDRELRSESKGAAARRLLAEFAARRSHDLMAMLAFSTAPIPIINFTHQQAIVQAAVRAAGVGHGIGDTDLGRALIAGLGMFRDRPYNGSRVILLVSDGGAHLAAEAQERLRDLMQRERVALYWLYLRTAHSPGLMPEQSSGTIDEESVPEHFLHQFFSQMGAPYHAYEAADPDALARAVADIDRLQAQPIRYVEPGVVHDLTGAAAGMALFCILALLVIGHFDLHP